MCFPWSDDEPAPATESEDATSTTAPCTEDYDAWFNVSSNGFWQTIPGHTSSSNRRSLPQHLKVRVDGPRSCRGGRYYFTIVEGPIANAGVHWDDRGNRQGNVSKTSGGTDVLVLSDPHTSAANITVAYSSFSVRTAGNGSQRYAVADVEGQMTYAGVTKTIRMQLDVITPNQRFNLSIPDFPHPGGNNYNAQKGIVWFRVDAETAPVNWSSDAVGNDRYFHLGTGSAGCFTNVSDGGRDRGWDTIVDALSKARDGGGLYVGTIRMNIPTATFATIRQAVEAEARRSNLPYIWNNQVFDP